MDDMPLRHEFVKGCQEFQYHPWSSSRLWQGREVLKELMLRNLDYSKKKVKFLKKRDSMCAMQVDESN